MTTSTLITTRPNLVVCIASIFLQLFSISLFGQTRAYKNFNDRNGLPSSEVYQIYQDKNGFIWFATDNGVVKYDGAEFALFNRQNGLPDPVVFGFYEDGNDRIWFRSFSGALSYYENGGVVQYSKNDLIKQYVKKALISDIAIDSLGQLWLTTSLKGTVSVIDTLGHFQRFIQKGSSIFFRKINCKDNIMGLCSPDRFTSHVYFREFTSEFSDGKSCYDIFSDTVYHNVVMSHKIWKGHLYFSMNRYIHRFDGKKVVNVFSSDKPILNISVDGNDHLWVGFQNGGVKEFADSDLTKFTELNELKGRSVTSTLQDKEGGYWFSTLDRGVFYFPNLSILNFDIEQESKISCVAMDKNVIYTGNLKGQVTSLNRFSNQRKVISDINASVTALIRDRADRLWVSTQSQTSIIEKHGQCVTSFSDLQNVRNFFLDKNGSVWAVNHSGAYKFDQNYEISIHRELSARLRSIFVDGNAVYIASTMGLEKYDTLFKRKTNLAYFEKHKISSVIKLDEHHYLIGSIGSGFFILKDGVVKEFKVNSGFLADNVYAATKDSSRIWLSTEKGIVKAKIQDLTEGIFNYELVTQTSGLPGDKNNFLVVVNDTLFAFSDHGYSVLPTRMTNYTNANPEVFVKRFEVNNRVNQLIEGESYSYDQNNFKIMLGCISFNNRNIQFRYRLNKKKWELGFNRELIFYSLAAGNYEMQIQYSAEGYSWKPVISNSFVIRPPWWETWYFRLVVFITFGAFVGLFVYFRFKSVKENQMKELESEFKLKMEKERISQDLHDNIGSHLFSLSLGLYELERKSSFGDQALSGLQDDLRSVISELRNTIWVINNEKIQLEEFGEKVKNLFSRFEQRNGAMQCSIFLITEAKDLELSASQAINLFRIIQEAAVNSWKHSEGTQLSIRIQYPINHMLSINIEDDGKGFDVNKNVEGDHYGLGNMKRRAEEIQSDLSIQSEPGKGTTISIWVPITKKN